MAEIVKLTDVRKWVGDGPERIEILKGISLTIDEGEFVAIMGASGSGKSTLLNLIGLLDTPSAGSLRLLGEEISDLSEDQLASRRAESLGFIFQSFNLLPYLSALDNVELPMTYTRHRVQRHERGRELLTEMNLSHRLSAFPATLSGGERQRVAIARSLANHPKLVLADEPTGALDSQTGMQIMSQLSALHHKGLTLVVVTHDETVARRAQRVIRMLDGKIR